jgi:NAD(P) transhydrogenase
MYYDVVIIGSGPAGQKAAVQAAKSGRTVCVVEQEGRIGGASVVHGALPTKVLRENAMRLAQFRQFPELNALTSPSQVDTDLPRLVNRMEAVMGAHSQLIENQTNRNLISRIPGRASLKGRYDVQVERAKGKAVDLQARVIVLACGSVPIEDENIQTDHEFIFDSESILNMLYLPKSLAVIGDDFHSCEYASIFQSLGVEVTFISSKSAPLHSMDHDVQKLYLDNFKSLGGRWLGSRKVTSATAVNGQVVIELEDDEPVVVEKALASLPRKAYISHLNLGDVGVELTENAFVKVNGLLQTSVSNIFAAGDCIGSMNLVSVSMEQGRQAICNAFRIPGSAENTLVPKVVYAIPEASSVGLTEYEAAARHKTVVVGMARFSEVVRGQISGGQQGFLKIVCDDAGERILGVHIIGENAAELIHIGQMGLLNENTIDIFIESNFNFPTLAEAYRIAALDVLDQKMKIQDLY